MLSNVLNKIFKNSRSSQKDGNFCRKISQITMTKPLDVAYYKLAFTHRSMNIVDTQGNPKFLTWRIKDKALLSLIIIAYNSF